uniref:Phospholipid/glycerol acyltransferase domain-containing protein n=1 Tax=Panagrolaimus superbus TaxID=310955 RepID=A0A914YVN7_9BILA
MNIPFVTIFVLPSTEHFVLLLAFMFPPILILVITVICLACVGKSFGLRERYVECLLRIFEWGSGEIHTALRQHKMFIAGGDDDLEDDETQSSHDDDSVTSSGFEDVGSEPRANNSDYENFSKTGSTNCLKKRTASAQSIIVRSADVNKIDEIEVDILNSRARAVLEDALYFMKSGLEAIVEDGVTCRFEAEQLASWNMLTRTSHIWMDFISWRLNLLYVLGFFFRYCFMLPLRFFIFCIGLIFLVTSTAVLGVLPDGGLKRFLNEKCMLCCYRILSRSITALIYFHDQHNKAKNGGICVANHTSPIDVLILNTDNCYALVGQAHHGLLGFVQRALSRSTNHIWFERSESRDRSQVAAALSKHADDPNNLPVLIFPEGTCINNTSVMQFKKGSFEVDQTIYPIAMKYDPKFGDAFWNSSTQGWFEYIIQMMSSWAIICHVWYLPPMKKLPNENAIAFANRVKKTIAARGGLVDLEWDGQLKRCRVSEKLIAATRTRYFKRLNRYASESEKQRRTSETRSSESSDESDLITAASDEGDVITSRSECAFLCTESEEPNLITARCDEPDVMTAIPEEIDLITARSDKNVSSSD